MILKCLKTVLIFLFFIGATPQDPSSHEFPCSSRAAEGIDWLLKEGEEKPLLKPVTAASARAASLVLFPLCAAADVAYNLHHEDMQGAQKSLLGLMATPSSLVSPDLVTHHFLPKTEVPHLITPYGKLYSQYAHEVFPESIPELQALLQFACHSEKSVAVMGSGMSQGKQALPMKEWDILVNMSKFKAIAIDPIKKTATVGAGATWKEVQNEANSHGLALRVMQASNIFSIGGSLSVNCHGWDHKSGSLSKTIISITLLDSKGQIRILQPSDELFHYVVGGYGGFGIIVDAEIALTENVPLMETAIEIAPQEYFTYFRKYVQVRKEIDMHLYRLSLQPEHLFNNGVAVNYHRINSEAEVSNLVEEPELGTRSNRVKMHLVRRLDWLHSPAWDLVKKEALQTKCTTRNEVMRPPINLIFNNSKHDTEWLQEYFVKGEDLADFLQFLGKILQENKVKVFNASVRYVTQDANSQLSYAKDGERFAVVLFFNQMLTTKEIEKTKRWVRVVIDYLIAHGGSYYLPYQHFATQEQFRTCYPSWQRVVQRKLEVDPESLFVSGFYKDYLLAEAKPSLFRRVFDRVDGQREQIRAFLHNVFMQLKEEEFFNLVDSILENIDLSDDEIYEELFKKINTAKPNKFLAIKALLKSLYALKGDLGDQVATLIQAKAPIRGYVEIGYNARLVRPLKKRFVLEGPIYVVNDQESLSDYVEAGGTRPYERFVPIDDYAPISEASIPSSSVDLVACYIGLHHVPPEKLDPFIASIKRILRPGGSFILMDHNAHTEDLKNLVDVVHSIFNVATGVSPQENQKEVRHFQSLNYWIDLLENHGLITHKDIPPLIRRGDSTLNSLIRFDKPVVEKEVVVAAFKQKVEYSRSLKQTYLTAPEWQNVWASQRYANFVERQPACRYPYFREIGDYWKVFGRSWKAARAEHSFKDVALSEYTFMNLFIGSVMTVEYGIKGVFALPAKLCASPRPDSPSPAVKEYVRSLKDYGSYIEHTPFYQYPYFNDMKRYWFQYSRSFRERRQRYGLMRTVCSQDQWKDLLRGVGRSVECTLKGIFSVPFALAYGSDQLKEAETLHLLVEDPDNQIEAVDSRIKVVNVQGEFKQIEIPRYFAFKEIILKMAERPSLECISIAGQSKIQMDVQYPRNGIPKMEGCRKLYEIPDVSTQKAFTAFEVEVCKLGEVIRAMKVSGGHIQYIHDF